MKCSPLSIGVAFLLVDIFLFVLINVVDGIASIAHDNQFFIYDDRGYCEPYLIMFAEYIRHVWFLLHQLTIKLIERVFLYIFSSINYSVGGTATLFDFLATSQSFILGFIVGGFCKITNRVSQRKAQ